MAERKTKTAAEKKAEAEAKDKAAEKDAEAEAKAAEKEAADAEAQGKVEDVEDVLQPTGGAEGTLEESKAKEEEEKGGAEREKAEGKTAEDEDEEVVNPVQRDANAEAAPFAGTAVAGSQEKTYNQVGQLYTDGLSGPADHNLDRAYGSGG